MLESLNFVPSLKMSKILETLKTPKAGIVGGATLGSLSLTPALVGLVNALGFSSSGIVAGSSAASMMAGAGNVVAGSTVAICQSIGATGTLAYCGTASTMGVPVIGAIGGGGLVFAGMKLFQRYRSNLMKK